MTLGALITTQFSLAQYGDFFLRIVIAVLCGAAIGFERSMRFKEAGIRTHMIVCSAAAIMMIVSKYGFADLADQTAGSLYGVRDADPSRIASQVVSGVSFLGAGIIFHKGASVRGLTTAAGIWATAGIGLAVGAGLYVIGIFSTAIIALLQVLMHKYSLSADSLNIGQVHCTVTKNDVFRKAINDYVKKHRIQIVTSKLFYNKEKIAVYDMTMRMSQNITLNELTEFLESIDGVQEVACELGQ